MRRVLKWALRLALAVVLLVVALTAYVYLASARRMSATYTVTPPDVTVPTDDAALARGKYLAENVAMCTDCHAKDLGGKVVEDNFPMGRLVAANLTRGRGGIGSTYRSADYVRTLMHGVRPDGRSVVFMPSADYHFTRADLAALIAYVSSVPPVDRELPPTSVGPLARVLGLFTGFPLAAAATIDHQRVSFAAERRADDAVAQGEYLISTAGCRGCHGRDLTGGGGPPPGASNLTPVGIPGWAEQDFLTALREHKRPNGSTLHEAMPRGYGQMADADLKHMFAYLRTVAPAGKKSANQP